MISPRGDNVWLESFPDEVRGARLNFKPRILVPYQAAEPSRFAKVLAIGPKVAQNGLIHVGDIVLCQRYGGAEAKDSKGEQFFFMRESEILAKVVIQ